MRAPAPPVEARAIAIAPGGGSRNDWPARRSLQRLGDLPYAVRMEMLERIASGFMEAKILLAAAELRVFEHLRGGGASAEALVRSLGWDRRGTEILLDALCAMGIVEKRGEVYRNRAEHEPFLLEGAGSHFVAMLRHRNLMFRRWALLEDRVRGEPSGGRDAAFPQITEAGANENFIRAMYYASATACGPVLDRLPLDGVMTIADLGGGPGRYLVELLARKPDVEPYLIDLPLTLEVARRILDGAPSGGRVRLVAWDFYAEEPPEGIPPLNLVLLSQVVHAESPEENRVLFRRIASLVAPRGRLAVHENVVGPSRTEPPAAALFAVNMLAMSRGGRTYTESEIVSWAEQAGFEHESSERLSERSFLILFRKPR